MIDMLLFTTECLLNMRLARSLVVNTTYGPGKALLGSVHLTRSSHRMQHRFLSEYVDHCNVSNKGAFGSNSVRRLWACAVAHSTK